MKLITDPEEFRDYCQALRQQHARDARDGADVKAHALGLVPTMGALHAGHISLVHAAQSLARVAVVSIFVNPTQFGPTEDLDRYPRDLSGDLAQCEAAQVDAVFVPSVAAMYPPGDQTRVSVSELTTGLCGASRPSHFTGVCTVVSKFFHLAGPCTAIFGLKDYQQFKVIERMARDLLLPVLVVGAPIFREPDGLAMSSRNRYLSDVERQRALALSAGIAAATHAFASGERDVKHLRHACSAVLEAAAVYVDYIEVVDAETLLPFVDAAPRAGVVMAVAAYVGKTRLIDNGRLDSTTKGSGT